MTADAILVTHTATLRHPVTARHIAAVTAPWRVVERVCIRPPMRDELDEFDENYPWAEAARSQKQQFREVVEAMAASPDAQLVYMGFAPVPLAFHLGSLFGQTADVAIFQHHHQNRDWRWYGEEETPGLLADRARPSPKRGSEQDVLIRVSGSYPVTSEDTRWLSGDKMHEYELSLAKPNPDGLTSAADVNALARAFKEVIDFAHNDFRAAPLRHLVAAVPVGAALAMGMQVNPTTHLPIQTWKYLGSRRRGYVRALRLGDFIDLPQVLVLGASPIDCDAITAAEEVQELALLLAKHERRVGVVQRPAAGIESLTTLLEEANPAVLHIAAHGELELDGTAQLRLSMTGGSSCLVGLADLLRLLGRAPGLSCVVFASCNSDELARSVAIRAKTSIGWNGDVGDTEVRKFSRTFWSSLVEGHNVDEAFRDGRLALRGARDQVVLHCGPGVNAEQVVPIPKI